MEVRPASSSREDSEAAAASAAATAHEQLDHDRRYARRGAALNFAAALGQSSLFLFGIVAVRLFGQETWGHYVTAMAWVDILARAALAGMDKAVMVFVPVRKLAGDHAGVHRVVGTAFRLTLTLGCVLGVLMFAFSWVWQWLCKQPGDGHALRMLSPAVVTASALTLAMSATMAARALRYNFWIRGIVEPTMTLALVAALGLTWPALGALALIPSVVGLVLLGLTARGLVRELAIVRPIAQLALPLESAVICYSRPLFLSDLLVIVLHRAPLLALADHPASARGLFSTCVLLAGTTSFVRNAFDSVFAPVAAEAVAAGDRTRLAANLEHQAHTVLTFALPIAAFMVVAGGPLLSLYDPAFTAGTGVLAILAGAHLLNAALGLTGWLLMASGRTATMLRNSTLTLAVNLGLCGALVPRWGITGAALAVFFSVATIQGAQAFTAFRATRVHPFSRAFAATLVWGIGTTVATRAVMQALRVSSPWAVLAWAGGGAALFLGGVALARAVTGARRRVPRLRA